MLCKLKLVLTAKECLTCYYELSRSEFSSYQLAFKYNALET